MVLGMVGLGWIASQADPSSKLVVEPRTVAVAVVSEIFSGRTPFATEDTDLRPAKAAGDEETKRLVTGVYSTASEPKPAVSKEAEEGSSHDSLDRDSQGGEPLDPFVLDDTEGLLYPVVLVFMELLFSGSHEQTTIVFVVLLLVDTTVVCSV